MEQDLRSTVCVWRFFSYFIFHFFFFSFQLKGGEAGKNGLTSLLVPCLKDVCKVQLPLSWILSKGVLFLFLFYILQHWTLQKSRGKNNLIIDRKLLIVCTLLVILLSLKQERTEGFKLLFKKVF